MRCLFDEEHEADGRQGVLQGEPQPQEVHQGEDDGRPQDLQLGVNITNFLRAQILHARSQKRKNTVKPLIFVALLGSECVKAARKMLVNFLQVSTSPTFYKKFFYNSVL